MIAIGISGQAYIAVIIDSGRLGLRDVTCGVYSMEQARSAGVASPLSTAGGLAAIRQAPGYDLVSRSHTLSKGS